MWVLNEWGKYEYGFMEIEKKYTKITKLLIRIRYKFTCSSKVLIKVYLDYCTERLSYETSLHQKDEQWLGIELVWKESSWRRLIFSFILYFEFKMKFHILRLSKPTLKKNRTEDASNHKHISLNKTIDVSMSSSKFLASWKYNNNGTPEDTEHNLCDRRTD